MKITTKTGDKGETSLFGGRRVSKASPYIELVGELDELQAVVGWCKVEAQRSENGNENVQILTRVIDDIYRMMSIVGFEFKCPGNIEAIGEKDVEFLEASVKKYEAEMDKVVAFVRPGESEMGARLHMARTVCRRVERAMVEVESEIEADAENAATLVVAMLKYLNRLSDFLFVLAYRA